MRYREAARKLARLGLRCSQARRLLPEVVYPQAQKDATLPDWGGRDLKTGTLRAVIRQLRMDRSEIQTSQCSAAANHPCVASSILPELPADISLWKPLGVVHRVAGLG